MQKKNQKSKQNKPTIAIMAGGTGGHIFPALAVAQMLRDKEYSLYWLGAHGLEVELVPKAGIPLASLPIKGLRGNGILGWLRLPFRLLKAVISARKILREVDPICVVGFGGFASVPGGIAAKLLRIPIVIHEQNAVPGLANRLLTKVSKATLSGFACDLAGNQVVGNPVRQEFFEIEPFTSRYEKRGDAPLNILILGGSQGARFLNELIVEVAEQVERPLNIWHQTGKQLFEEAEAKWLASSVTNYKVAPFIDGMAEAYGWADLVICRAGALTIAELMAVNVASVLIPFPYAVDDHQTKNAQVVVDHGAALLYQEKTLQKQVLVNLLETVSRDQLVEMASKSQMLSKPNATKDIVATIEKVVK